MNSHKKCRECGSKNVTLAKRYISNGAIQVLSWCWDGKHNAIKPAYYHKQSAYIRELLDNLPMIEDNRKESEPCAVCGSKDGTEYHHFAPRYLFGNDADKWPGAMLCRKCHLLWHQLVTPRMTERL